MSRAGMHVEYNMLLLVLLLTLAIKTHALSSPKPEPTTTTTRTAITTATKIIHNDRRNVLQSIFFSACTTLTPITSEAVTDEGLPAVTDSSIGRLFRQSTIRGARLFDRVDERWERFSDKLRDEKKCDENTGRRLFDNGVRRDGTRVGNPVLGSLCRPEPLMPLDLEGARQVVDAAVGSALLAGAWGGDRAMLERDIRNTKDLVRQSFDRARQVAKDEEEQKRIVLNFELYSNLRAIQSALRDSAQVRNFQILWGRELFTIFAPTTDLMTKDNYSLLSLVDITKDEFDDDCYDKRSLINPLTELKSSLDALKRLGLAGVSEISIPSDDYGNVVTIAIDDYVPLSTEMLLAEQNLLVGGPAQALVRATMEKTAIKRYDFDSYFIDPSTTKQSEYNPTQLLLSLNNLCKL